MQLQEGYSGEYIYKYQTTKVVKPVNRKRIVWFKCSKNQVLLKKHCRYIFYALLDSVKLLRYYYFGKIVYDICI
jgi:hypothetical protein